jgi:ketosteroid isomerase-like protein
MTNTELVRRFWNLFSEQKWEDAMAFLHQDVVVTWPQSKEKMIGSKNFIDVNRNYPGNHKIEIIKAHEIGTEVITTVWIIADTGQKTFATSYFQILDGKIKQIEEYWAEPYQAPEWRSQWVESL